MTALAIIPNYDRKRLRIVGTVAAGEHVAVTVVGGGEWVKPDENSDSQTLRLRVLFGGHTVAVFPYWTEARDIDGETVAADAWSRTSDGEVSAEGEDATCELVLNTIPAEKMLRCGGNCLWILDDPTNHVMYGAGEFEVMPWPKYRPHDLPYRLDDYPDFVNEAKEAIAGFGARLDDVEFDVATAESTASTAKTIAQTASATATDAYNAAVTAQGNAQDSAAAAAESAAAAAESATAAQEALGGIYPTDPDLEEEGRAADAKAVGDALDAHDASLAALDAAVSSKAAASTVIDIGNGLRAHAGNSQAHVSADDRLNWNGKADKATTYTKTQVDDKIAAAESGKFIVVAELPAAVNGQRKAIYLLPREESETGNSYDEYIVVEADGESLAWEKIGSTVIDLSAYALKSEVPSASSSAGSAPNVNGAAGESSAYARGDHKHPQETEVIPAGYRAPDSWFPITFTETHVKPGSQTPEVYNYSLTRDFVDQNAVYDSTEGEYQIKDIFGNVVLVFEREVFDPPEEGRVLFTSGAGDSGSLRLNGTAPVVGTTELEYIPQQTVKVRGVAVARPIDIPSGKADADAIAPEFDSMETYHEGDLVMREGKLFICKVAEFHDEFSPSGFDPWDVASEIYDLWGRTDELNEEKEDRAPARPLCFTAVTANSSVTLTKSPNFTLPLSLEYSTDGGATWSSYTVGSVLSLSSIRSSVMLRATSTNQALCMSDSNYGCKFSITGWVEASGDLTSLLGPYADPPAALPQRCFNLLFQNCARLMKAPDLPATRLGKKCYQSLFAGCTGLTEAPYLPATELNTGCYQNLFNGCTNLRYISAAFTAWGNCASWVDGVAASGVFCCPPGLSTATRDAGHVPSGWTVRQPYTAKEAYDEAKDAKQLSLNRYNSLFGQMQNLQPKWFTNPADVGHEEAGFEYPDVFPLSVQLASMDGGDTLVFDDINDWKYSMMYDQYDLRWGDSFGEFEDLSDLEVDLTGRNLLCLQINGWAGGSSGWGTLAAWDTDSGELIYRRNNIGPSDEPYAPSTIPNSIVVRGGSTVPVLSYYVNQTQVHDDSALAVVFDDMDMLPYAEDEMREVVWELDATDVPTGSTITIVWPGTAYGAARPETGTGEDEENLVAEPGYTNVFKMFEVASDKWLVKRYLVAASLAPGDGGSSDSGLWS